MGDAMRLKQSAYISVNKSKVLISSNLHNMEHATVGD